MSPEVRRELLSAAVPRGLDPYVPHPPHPPQALFLLDQGREAFYGGAAGGGKSDALLMAALQYVDVPRYSALIIRRTYSDLTLPGAIMDRADEWLSQVERFPAGAAPRPFAGRGWEFPSGARLTFGYIRYPRDKGQFKSAEFQMVGFDELTQFAETTYTFMFSRLRRPAVVCENCSVMVTKISPGEVDTSKDGEAIGLEVADEDGWVHRATQTNYDARCARPQASRRALAEYPPSELDGTTLFDVPLRMRAASNPGDVGHAWVRDRFVDPERRLASASFYPARITDNPSLDQEEYSENLGELGLVEKMRLLDGDWDAKSEGKFFKRDWFQIIRPEDVPDGVRWCRYWDLAATAAADQADPDDPDWTVGALVGISPQGQWYLAHIAKIRDTPLGVQRFIKQTALEDGPFHPIRMEQEGGASGVNTIDHYRREVLYGYDFDRHSPRGSKEDRARTWSAAAQNDNFFVVHGSWVREFLDEAEAFPDGVHDDQIDAVSGAVAILRAGPSVQVIV